MNYYIKNRNGFFTFHTFSQYHFTLVHGVTPVIAHGPYLGRM